MIAVSVQAFTNGPCERVGVTITALGTMSDSIVSVWRTADGERSSVRGARRVTMSDSAYVIDYDAPLGRPITYEVEVISGPAGPSRTTSEAVTVVTETGSIMDPLVPQSAVKIVKRMTALGEPTFTVEAMKKLDYAADLQLFNILGSKKPMALFGERMAAAGVDFSVITDAEEQNTRLEKLLEDAGQLLVRVPASWEAEIPGSWFAAVGVISKLPHGGALTTWQLSGDTVEAPAIRVLTALFTYGDVNILYSTYQQKQTLMAGKSYLSDLKNPLGG
ncbi:hypothetical protein SRABI26_04398 [Arthrobacter sp. Bi26]|uniref:hypothetical protein n=1 Tax=Arthrobacter sp. Bi26 TaxID=2822350 RepID=UPI001DBBA533|nr:hypothetical protein [Arthrobacter sp. Bi26]CAH0296556.1 hypothetical protein SRABI26_04398 [Arthrobacter sp. Bi26]